MRLYIVDNPSDSLLLRSKAKKLNWRQTSGGDFEVLQERMLATVNDPDNPGVGIAAPQVGIPYRLIAVQRLDKEGEPFEFYVNPRIESFSGKTDIGIEGCLSVPGLSGPVERDMEITISYDANGAGTRSVRKTETIGGYTAIIFQHEIDHLDGILYTDRIVDEPE